MILSVGEILADIVNTADNNYLVNLGGAPFNLAVNAKNQGANVGFVGVVGKDVVGDKLTQIAKGYNLDSLTIQQSNKNTTLAFVALNNGERGFSFFRNADYMLDYKSINLSSYKNLKILHLGSLMLSEKQGQKAVKNLTLQAKKLNIKVSFDVNLRDIFKNKAHALKSYNFILNNADIIKLSLEELEFFTGEKDFLRGINIFAKPNVLYVISFGEKGSGYYYNNQGETVATQKVTPIDTTGAGDAFYGTFLANILNKPLNKETIVNALNVANKVGAETTLFYGALKQ